jgi:hypothetical protein
MLVPLPRPDLHDETDALARMRFLVFMSSLVPTNLITLSRIFPLIHDFPRL